MRITKLKKNSCHENLSNQPFDVIIVKISDQKQIINDEATALSLVENQYVVKLIYYFATRNQVYQILEYCDSETLEQFWLKSKKTIPVTKVINFIDQIFKGLLGFQQMNIQYFDLSLKKILLHQNQIRLSDKGYIPQNFDSGTTAPEAKSGQYNIQANIFSLGCITYQMLFGELPFERGSNYLKSVSQCILFILFKEKINFNKDNVKILDQFKFLIIGMLKPDPQTRWNVEKIQKYIKDIQSDESQQIIFEIQNKPMKYQKSWLKIFNQQLSPIIKNNRMQKFQLVQTLLQTFDEISTTPYQPQTQVKQSQNQINIYLFILYKKCRKAWLNLLEQINEGTQIADLQERQFYENFPEQELKLMLNDIKVNPDSAQYLSGDWEKEMNIDNTERLDQIYIEAVKKLLLLIRGEIQKVVNKEIKKKKLQIMNKLQILLDFDQLYKDDVDLTESLNEIQTLNQQQLLQKLRNELFDDKNSY